MLQASETSKQAKTPHERTPLGRALLKVQRGVYDWIDCNQRRATPEALADAERLACELGEAAWNGLAANKAALLEWADKIEADRALLRRYSPTSRE